MRRAVSRLATGVLITVVAASACSSGGSGSAGGSTVAPATSPATAGGRWVETRVPVGDGSISVRCKGATSTAPPVVFLTGLGLDAESSWLASGVPDTVSASTKACVYDRPGLGRSTSSTTPRDLDHHADELDAVVRGVGLPTPIVLVAQGYGSFVGRVYATPAKHQDAVAGLVLLDPPLWPLDPTPPAGASEGQQAEYATVSELNDQLGRYGAAAMPPPPVPIVVYGADPSRPSRPPGTPGGTVVGSTPPGTVDPTVAVRHERQKEYADKSPFGQFEVIDGAGAELQFWKPDLVVQAVRSLPSP